MFNELTELFAAQEGGAEDQPVPVNEVPDSLVRIPAFDNGQWLVQGALFFGKGEHNYFVRLDDGRFATFQSVKSAWAWFLDEAHVWA